MGAGSRRRPSPNRRRRASRRTRCRRAGVDELPARSVAVAAGLGARRSSPRVAGPRTRRGGWAGWRRGQRSAGRRRPVRWRVTGEVTEATGGRRRGARVHRASAAGSSGHAVAVGGPVRPASTALRRGGAVLQPSGPAAGDVGVRSERRSDCGGRPATACSGDSGLRRPRRRSRRPRGSTGVARRRRGSRRIARRRAHARRTAVRARRDRPRPRDAAHRRPTPGAPRTRGRTGGRTERWRYRLRRRSTARTSITSCPDRPLGAVDQSACQSPWRRSTCPSGSYAVAPNVPATSTVQIGRSPGRQRRR